MRPRRFEIGPDRAVTLDAAYQSLQETQLGSLQPGKWADLVILSRSPLEDPERIDEMTCWRR